VQVIDFIEFFVAQKIIKVFRGRIGAALRPVGTGLPTKLSTGSVGDCGARVRQPPGRRSGKKAGP
jgi:hypothetical protein